MVCAGGALGHVKYRPLLVNSSKELWRRWDSSLGLGLRNSSSPLLFQLHLLGVVSLMTFLGISGCCYSFKIASGLSGKSVGRKLWSHRKTVLAKLYLNKPSPGCYKVWLISRVQKNSFWPFCKFLLCPQRKELGVRVVFIWPFLLLSSPISILIETTVDINFPG